jgi:hypothetical protein
VRLLQGRPNGHPTVLDVDIDAEEIAAGGVDHQSVVAVAHERLQAVGQGASRPILWKLEALLSLLRTPGDLAEEDGVAHVSVERGDALKIGGHVSINVLVAFGA